jgi:hypothetical protein
MPTQSSCLAISGSRSRDTRRHSSFQGMARALHAGLLALMQQRVELGDLEGQEVRGRRKSGARFPISISVSATLVDGEPNTS